MVKIMPYFILTIVLFGLLMIYFKIADKYNIIDKPNYRSAHSEITLRGGGIIFWLTALLYGIAFYPNQYLFLIGITLISLVSFWDDIKSLPNKIRLVAHFIAISAAFFSLNLFQLFPVWLLIVTYIVFIGIINAYNFMDGINGITGVYSLVVLLSLLFVNEYVIKFVEINFILYPIVASLVFLFFNFRKRAKCFAGDVGSIGMAYWVVYLLLLVILKTNNLVWILFLLVYGVDTVCTIIHRLYLRENIFEAHRHHFYQILCNEYKIQHRYVALGYGILQLIVSYTVIECFRINNYYIVPIIIIPILLVYLTKFYLIKK